MNAVFYLFLWIIAEQPPRLADVGIRLRYVTRLQRLAINDRMLIEFLFQQGDQFAQFDGARLTEIDHFKITLIIIYCGPDTGDYVVDKSVIAPRCAITKNRNRG